MPRGASAEAKRSADTSYANSQNLFGQLVPQAQSLVNSPGYDPATLAAITNAGMGGVNSAFSNAKGQLERDVARTNNPAGATAGLDQLAMQEGIAGGKEAGDIQIQNADFQNRQRLAGLNLMNSMYGTNMGQTVPAINAQTSASPGWVQSFTDVLKGVGGLIKPIGLQGSQGSGAQG